MTQSSIPCTSCRRAFPVPGDGRAPWVTCPHCGAKVANAFAPPRRHPGLIVPAVLLVLLGGVGATAGTFFYVIGIGFATVHSGGQWALPLTIVWLGSFVCLLVGGVFLNYAATQPVARLGDLGARVLAILGAVILVGFAGAIVAFAVCARGFSQ